MYGERHRAPTGFKIRPNTHFLDLAPTSRAKCKSCKRVVEKGEPRVVTNLFVRPGRWAKASRHAACAAGLVVSGALEVERLLMNSEIDPVTVAAVRAQLEKAPSSSTS